MSPVSDRGGLLVDLGPARDFLEAEKGVERTWREMSPSLRRALTRILWLRPDGQVIQYRSTEEVP